MYLTLKEIAKIAGTSHSTVSRALRNHPRLSKSTCSRIQKLARKLGYKPDPALVGLAAYRSKIRPPSRYEKIAILSHLDASQRLPQKFSEHIDGIRSRSLELGFKPELFKVESDPKLQHRLSRSLYYQGVRGIIILPLPRMPSTMDWRLFSLVGIGENTMPLGINYISTDHDTLICEIYAQLKLRGYKNIGYMNMLDSETHNRFLFYGSYLKCRALDGLAFAPPLFHEPGDLSNFIQWLKQNHFDAIICSDLKTRAILAESDFKAPETPGLVGMSLTMPQAKASGFACYIIDGTRLGRLAVDFIQSLIQKNQCGIPKPEDLSTILIRGHWLDGATVREIQSL